MEKLVENGLENGPRSGLLLDDRVSRLLGMIYESALDPAGWESTLAAISVALNASMVSLLEHHCEEHTDRVLAATGLDPSYAASYEGYYCSRNIYLERAKPFLYQGLVAPHERFVENRVVLGSEYYNDFQRRLDLFRVAAGVICHRPDRFVLLSFNRTARAKPFSSSEFALVSYLLPHLRRSLLMGDLLRANKTSSTPVVASTGPNPRWHKFGFTPTEMRVALLLIEGRSMPEVAAVCAVQVSTARSHLRRLFEKTSTRRQSELVACLLGVERGRASVAG